MFSLPFYSSLALAFSAVLAVGHVHAQSPSSQTPKSASSAVSPAVDPAGLEGVTLKNGASSILVLANVSIQKTGSSRAANTTASGASPTLLKKIGAFEIHKATVSEAARVQAQGQSLPAFAQVNAGSDFVGVAYLNDIRDVGLISKEVVARFNRGQVPAQYQSRNPVELVKGSGLYVFVVADVYDWIRLVSRLQADTEVSLVEPQIKTSFASPR